MERKIGEIFEYNGEWYQVVECGSCGECSLFTTECGSGTKSDLADEVFGQCSTVRRSDNKHAIFKKLEKVGEPMKIHNRIVLKVKADAYKCMSCCFYSKAKCELTMQECEHYDCGEGTKFIEIKQTKEDMEEKKEGWVNVYKGSVCISVYPRIYKSREEAVSDNTTVNRIDTVKITWEE